ncbi:ribonuclease H-like domain-containing protein [Tanacetum coccineum]
MVPRTVLTRFDPISVNVARPVNTVQSRTTLNNVGPVKNVINYAYSTTRRPFNKITAANNSNFTKKVNTVKGTRVNTARPKADLSAVKGNNGNAIKASAYYEKIDAGFVAFGGNSKGGKITRKDFKLTDESHVLLKVPRKDNMYNVDLRNVVPQGGLTCLFANATLDESNLWHRRLGHVNFKTMNKLVRGSLVRGIKNLIDLRVKVIRCDNGTEFKNRVMNQFCEIKGIKRKFSVTRTPQQNRVAERKNKALIEAARTMLADSKLPTTFWAEAVNTACYVQNRVLVIKPHNKTPYELFIGRKHDLSFMRLFGCPVTILNTINHLGKFNGKADEGFFIGYSTSSKAFRVFNSRTRIVEENLHVQFSENILNIAGSKARMEIVLGKDYILLPMWPADPLFSQDSKSSPDARFKPSREEEKKDAKDLGNEDSEVPSTEEPREDQRVNQVLDAGINNTNNINTASDGNNTNNVNAVSLTVNAAVTEVNVVDPKTSIELPNDPNMPELEDIIYSNDDEDVYRNKKDEIGIVIKNKARLVTQGYTQEEGIDYDEVFALVTRIEAIRLFLAYASFKDFVVYQMDVKSAFLYGKIEEEVYVCQPPGFEDPEFPDRVYKVEKALYGLHQAPKACDVKTASTPMETYKPLLKDADGEDVDEHLYISMIGSLIYLNSSRPDIMFAICDCARFQVNAKSLHLHAVKRIFRYLKGQPKLGLWYPKDSPFDLVAYTDSEYARASLDRKSTTGGCQFLGRRLISWQCKKQTVTKIHNDNESTICIVKNPVFHSKTKHIEIRHHFIRDSNEKKLIQMIKIHTNQNVLDLLTKAFDATAKVKTINEEKQLQALVDRKKVIITESTIRRDLQLEDAEGTDCLPNATIFEQLTLMGAKTTAWNEFSSIMASAITCLATNQKFNFSKYIFDNMVKNLEGGVKFLIFFANMKREGKCFSGRVTPLFQTMMVQAQEEGEGSVMPVVPQHTPTINQPLSSQPQKKQKTRKSKKQNIKVGLSAKVISSDDKASLGDQEDASKQGRKILDIVAAEDITLDSTHFDTDPDMLGVHDLHGDQVFVETQEPVVNAATTTSIIPISIATATTTTVDELTLAQTLIKIKAAKPKVRGVMIQEPSETTTTTTTPAALKPLQDKGKAKMTESEKPLKKKDQIMYDQEVALNLQAQLQAELEEEERLARQKEKEANIALIES